MSRPCRLLALISILLWLPCSALPAGASMPPGHVYAAIEAYKRMPPGLQKIVRENRNAYLLGCQGHDLAYWAPDAWWIKFLNEGGLYNPIRLRYNDRPGAFMHEGLEGQGPDSGRFIMHLLELATEQDRLYGEYPRASNVDLAFTLGWISHWVTDTYIHTLVERYGGLYDTVDGQKRHVQLELLEAKQVAVKHGLSNIDTQPDQQAFYFLSRAMRRFYTGKVFETTVSSGRLVSDGRLAPTYKVVQDFVPPVFVEMLNQGAFIIADAMACLRQSTRSGLPKCDGWAKLGWIHKMHSQLVGNENYQHLMNPIEIAVEPKADKLLIKAVIFDHGLYGKFCVDWENVMAQAIAAHGPIYSALDNAFANFRPRDMAPGPTPPLPGSLKALFPDINILSPEKTANLLPQGLLAYYDDTRRGDPFPLKDVYYEVKLGKRTVSGRAKLERMPDKDSPKLTQNLYHNLPGPTEGSGGSDPTQPGVYSSTPRLDTQAPAHSLRPSLAEIEIALLPDDPPHDQIEVKVSLTDEKPLTRPMEGNKPRYEGVEFAVLAGARPVGLRLPGAVVDAYAGQPYTFKAGLPASRLPRQPLFMWRVTATTGGAPITVNTATGQYTHTFPAPGQYYVAVFLYDKKSGDRQGAGSTMVLVNDAGLGKEERGAVSQRQAAQEATYISTINQFPGANIEEKFQAYCLANQKQTEGVGPMDPDALLKHSMNDARNKYRAERGEEMPPEAEAAYEQALRQQIGLFTKAYAEPPKNLYKPDKK